VARDHSRAAVLAALCRLVEATVGYCYCGVVLVDPSGTRLEYGRRRAFPPASSIQSLAGP
jgi:hypothetical protein